MGQMDILRARAVQCATPMSQATAVVPAAVQVMVDVRGLSKIYEEPSGGEIAAADNVSLACKAGEIFGLLGPNGAGKTTTLRCLATILTPTRGGATVAGYDLLKQPEMIRRSIGFLSGTTGVYARLTPRETLRFFGAMYGWSGDRLERRVEEVLAMFDVTSYADRPNDRLSTGMKQRVGLARAVVHDPPVLILDEPTSGLTRSSAARSSRRSGRSRRQGSASCSRRTCSPRRKTSVTGSVSSARGRSSPKEPSPSCAR